MKIPTILSALVLLLTSYFVGCTKSESLEFVDPNDAKVIGYWRFIYAREWQQHNEFNIFGELTSTPDHIIEIKKGDFQLENDQLTYLDRVYTVKFKADTMWWYQSNSEHRYQRVK